MTAALTSADPWLGRVIDNRYRVGERIGTGGMGVVYRVEHLHLGKTAAMKVLSPDTAAKPEMLRRFRLEAQSVSKLNHPNIVQTFDFGQCDGAFYLVMEYIKGDDLAALLRREGPWSFARAARLFIQVCSGLTEAHDAGIVHRDLKPENLMVVNRRDGTEHVKVLDFGLAKLRERADGAGISTGGQVLGTPYYMAPEQVRGERIDARADIYSLGATLYRVLTGEPPFDAPSPMWVLTKHLTDDLVPPRDRVPGGRCPWKPIASCCARWRDRPRSRYASAAEVQQIWSGPSLRRAASCRPRPPWRCADPSPPARRSRRRRPRTRSTVPRSAVRPRSTTRLTVSGASDVSDEAERLRRADVDDYEWSLRRQRLLMSGVLSAVALAVVASAVLFYLPARPRTERRPRARTEQHARPTRRCWRRRPFAA